MTLVDRIVNEVMEAIAAKRRINKDDLRQAVDRAMQDERAAIKRAPPIRMVYAMPPTVDELLAWAEAQRMREASQVARGRNQGAK